MEWNGPMKIKPFLRDCPQLLDLGKPVLSVNKPVCPNHVMLDGH